MKTWKCWVLWGLLGCLGLGYGCGGDDGPDPVGPSVGGDGWSGVFYHSDDDDRDKITATVSQEGDAIVITTSRERPPGQTLTGTITAEGEMTLTDASNGETWTTHFGATTANYIKIADFVETPVPGEPKPPLAEIEIRR